MPEQVVAAKVDREELRDQIQAKYVEVALEPEKGFHFHTGRPLAAMLGYDSADVDWLPETTVESFAGTGNPLSMGPLAEGEIVLDIGCGAGFDTLLAALGLDNVDARHGYAEELPAEDESIDVVISNGVINLCPDKMAVMQQVYRVLKPGGRFQIADIVVHMEVPQDAKDDIDLWSGGIAGALLEAEWQWVLDQLGFTDVRWGPQIDVFSGSKHESDAAEFETRGVTFTGAKPR